MRAASATVSKSEGVRGCHTPDPLGYLRVRSGRISAPRRARSLPPPLCTQTQQERKAHNTCANSDAPRKLRGARVTLGDERGDRRLTRAQRLHHAVVPAQRSAIQECIRECTTPRGVRSERVAARRRLRRHVVQRDVYDLRGHSRMHIRICFAVTMQRPPPRPATPPPSHACTRLLNGLRCERIHVTAQLGVPAAREGAPTQHSKHIRETSRLAPAPTHERRKATAVAADTSLPALTPSKNLGARNALGSKTRDAALPRAPLAGSVQASLTPAATAAIHCGQPRHRRRGRLIVR